jgi:hypothetical protein
MPNLSHAPAKNIYTCTETMATVLVTKLEINDFDGSLQENKIERTRVGVLPKCGG